MIEDHLRVRVGQEDIHYGSGVAAGAYVLQLFGDLAGVLSILHDGDGGLLAGYDRVDFMEPVHAGDLLHVTGRLIRVGDTSRSYEFECVKVLTQHGIGDFPSSGDVLDPPVPVARATATVVVRREKMRRKDPQGARLE